MRIILLAGCLLALTLAPAVARASAEGQEIPLWNHAAPGSPTTFPKEVWTERGKAGVRDRSVEEVHVPTITVYLASAAKANGAAVVICPGGGFSHLAIDKEGHDIARWLNANGIAGLVVKYRLPKSKAGSYTVDTALGDVRRAIRTARYRAAEWHLDPDRIGLAGFSAGGTLVELAGTRFDRGIDAAADPIDRQSSRPDFLISGYTGGVGADLGVTSELIVTKDTPPVFMVHADDDKVSAMRSIQFYSALKQAGVPAELHIYARGGHGFGVVDNHLPVSKWGDRCLDWLNDRGLLKRR